jgi:nicotinic acid mononucleotide adenylyltransferase
MERKLKKSVTPKYLEFFTYLYNKKFFSLNLEIRNNGICSYTKDALLQNSYVRGKGHAYRWIAGEPTIADFDKIWQCRQQLKDNKRAGKEQKQETKSAPITKQESLFISEERAIELLKSKGYKIFKPVTDFQEI